MFFKKIVSTILSVGILSACCITAFAGSTSDYGYSNNHEFPTVRIDYSLSTEYTPSPYIISKMWFNNASGSNVNCYIETTKYMKHDPDSSELTSWTSSGGSAKYVDNGNMECIFKEPMASPSSLYMTNATFHYSSDYHGSFTGSLSLAGF